MAWTSLKRLIRPQQARSDAGGGSGNAAAKTARWLALALAGGLWGGGALAASDLLLAQHVVAPDPVLAGGVTTITMTIQNNGTEAASNVTLTDVIPPGSTFVSMSATEGGTCTSAAPYTCSWSSIPYPGARVVTLKVKLPTATVWINEVAVTSATTDNNTGNNSLTRNITAVAAVNLDIKATASVAGSIAAGKPYSYALKVTNTGGPNALPAGQSPRVTFNVPTGSSITARPTGTGWSCQPAASSYPLTAPAGVGQGAEITCSRDDGLAVGASFPDITVPMVANVLGAVDATFDVKSNFPDNDTSDNVVTERMEFTDGTNMSIKKTVVLSADVSGTLATFTLQARQEGGVSPAGVTVTDTLPDGLDYVSHSPQAPWSCTLSVKMLTCNYPGTYSAGPFTDLPTITLVAKMSGVGDIPNTGVVSATPPDPDGTNDTSTVIVNNSADLRISKSPSVNPVVTGASYNWNITVRNHGPMPVLAGQTITVTETVPAGMTLTALAGGSQWSCSTLPISGPVDVTCTHTRSGNLGVNSDAPTLTISATNSTAGTLTNNACLALSGAGPVESGGAPSFKENCVGSGITGTISVNSADLQITKTVSPALVVVGQDLTYTLVATNLSPTVEATNVHVYDTINNLVGVGSLQSITTTLGSCTPAGAYPRDGASQVVDCNLGTLSAGGIATITIVVRPNNTTAAVLSRPNTASVNSLDVGDPIRGNNSATISSNVDPRVDATVTKTVNPSSDVRVGQPMVYTVTARNNGPSTANTLTITDVMPPNTAFISVGTPSNSGTCSSVPAVGSTGGTLICNWANVAVGNRTVSFTVRPLAAALNTTITNTVNVSVGATDTETDTTNNSSTVDTNVIDSLVDILVQKTDSVDPVALGAETMYTVTIRNAGPSVGTELLMIDTFPNAGNTARFSYQGGLTAKVAGVEMVTPDCQEPDIGAMSGTLECKFPTIGVGAPNEVLLTYRMRAESIISAGAYSGTQGNHVTVAVAENEVQLTNNQVDEDTTTSRAAPAAGSEIDLGIAKTTGSERALPGTEFDYALRVTNMQLAASGRDVIPGHGAQVTDTLPAGLTFVSAPGCSYDLAARQVVCVVSNLVAGASVDFTVRVLVDSPYTGLATLSNTACVDMPGDSGSGNNCSTVSKTVGNPPPPPPSDPRGSIGCTVFDDLNSDGTRDAGESGVAGITIRLLNAQNQPVTSTVTAADGSYSFVNLMPGTYTVQKDVPKGYSSTTPATRQVTVLANQNAPACFGLTTNPEPGSIGCSVFDDTNQDGSRDPSEKGLSGLTVRLFNDKDEEVATTTTAADGNYSFPELAPGAYKVSYVLPKGYSSTSLVERSITVLPGKKADACFGALPGKAKPGSVGCSVFDDLNNNGQRDADEDGLAGITVRLLDADGKLLKTTTSATDGTYGFPDLAPGSYTVETDLPKGYTPTGSTSRQFTLTEGANVNACFGAIGGPGVLKIVKTLYEGWNAGGACGTSVAKKELLIVEKIATEHELTWCFEVTNPGNKHLGAPVWKDSAYPGMVATAKAGTTLPLAPGATGTWYFEAKHKSSVVNVVGVKMPVTDPAGKLIPDVPPASSSDDGKATFGMIYDPPYGVKVGSVEGADIINWTMVWVNDNVIAANNVYVSDTVKAPMEFVPDSLSCVGEGATSVVAGTCQYVAGTKTVSARANFAADLGKTVANASNRLFISFKVKVPKTGGSTSYENQGEASWTPPGGSGPLGSVTVFVPKLKIDPIDPKDPKVPTVQPPPGVGVNDPLIGHPDPSNPGTSVETPVQINPDGAPPEPPKPPPPTIASIPTLSEWGVILLSCLMGLFALRQVSVARRR